MKWTIIWALIVGAVVALILLVTAVSMSASGFQLDVERWVLIGAFLVVISMGTAVMVSVLSTLKDVRQRERLRADAAVRHGMRRRRGRADCVMSVLRLELHLRFS